MLQAAETAAEGLTEQMKEHEQGRYPKGCNYMPQYYKRGLDYNM